MQQDIRWLQGRLALLESIIGIICCSPAAPSPAALEVRCSQLSHKPVDRATDSSEQAIYFSRADSVQWSRLSSTITWAEHRMQGCGHL